MTESQSMTEAKAISQVQFRLKNLFLRKNVNDSNSLTLSQKKHTSMNNRFLFFHQRKENIVDHNIPVPWCCPVTTSLYNSPVTTATGTQASFFTGQPPMVLVFVAYREHFLNCIIKLHSNRYHRTCLRYKDDEKEKQIFRSKQICIQLIKRFCDA